MEPTDDLAFWEVYRSLVNSRQITRLQENLTCRFCGKTEPETTFQMVPHAIPELLGANQIIAGDECDACNQRFSASESHLARFLGPYLTMGHVKGKRKVPQFESRTEPDHPASKTVIESVDPGKRKVWLDDLMDYRVDEERKLMSLTFRVASFRPAQVYRALVKIGLSLLPAGELPRYQNVIDWLKDPEKPAACFPMLFLTVLTRKKFPEPYAELFQAIAGNPSSTHVPGLSLVLGSGQLILQIFLPEAIDYDTDKMSSQYLSVELFPGMLFDEADPQGKYQFRTYDLGSDQPVTLNETINLKYESGDFNIGQDQNNQPIEP